MKDLYDILIIGGGINGTAVARDASGRGLNVLLCERDDLAEHTSSASTKLIHGGLRYLEYYEFRLVREALKEREVLLKAAPHIIWPLRFVLPYEDGMRPKWMLRTGLFLYDHIGGREELPGTEKVKLKTAPHEGLLKPHLTSGFEYSDCWVEDSRLVVLNAMDAKARGADIRTRTEVVSVAPHEDGFEARLGDGTPVRAKAVVNAAGPWVDELLERVGGLTQEDLDDAGLRLVRGSHIVTKRLFAHDDAYIFQNADGRIVFAIPYEQDYTLIGTTDEPHDLEDGLPEASEKEIAYLCDAINEYFVESVSPDDVVWSFSGVRPLYDDKSEDASEVTRDYVLDLDRVNGAPILSAYGGKITTSRKLGEHAVDMLASDFEGLMGPSWTGDAPFPGGDIPDGNFEGFVAATYEAHADLPADLIYRLCRHYGTRVGHVLELGQEALPGGLLDGEVQYLVRKEWARTAEDVLWRRTKRGLHMSDAERAEFAAWFECNIDVPEWVE